MALHSLSHSTMPLDKAADRARKQRERDEANQAELDAYLERLEPYQPATADSCFDWLESLTVAAGPRQGSRFRILPYQRDFLTELWNEESTRRRFGLAVARRNGKSMLASLAALTACAGPQAAPERRWRGAVISLTLDHASEISTNLMQLADANDLPLTTQTKPNAVNGLFGSQLLTLAASPRAAVGVGLQHIYLDECGLWDSDRHRTMYENAKASLAGVGGRLVGTSILGHSDLFAELKREAKDYPELAYWQEHSAWPGAALDDPEAHAAANPGLGETVSAEYLMTSAKLSLDNAAAAHSFRIQHLNLKGNLDKQSIVGVHEYERCLVDTLPPRAGAAIIGLDIGAANSLTGCAVVWPETWRFEVWGGCASIPDLHTRSKADNVGDLYVRLAEQHELFTTTGRSLDVEEFLRHCESRLQGVRVAACVTDSFKAAEVQDALDAAGLNWPLIERRGIQAMSEDCRYFIRGILEQKPKMLKSELLANSISSSALITTDEGNSRLSKSRSHGRIDALSASLLAISHAMRHPIRKRRVRILKAA